ncbi:hypothetical protein F511_38034 [Dorcoceras hygrometricum]|uniref:Uncharacterized protein n=1 Tax=Dorcoceras hygrometricum TaxID=472368 RepID=A0A2Z7BXJ4_9LAMI|nr:hypothetical protein F511_38034 [Dorcoceras hygrometricum]
MNAPTNAMANEVGSSHVSQLNAFAEPYTPLMSLQQEYSRIRRVYGDCVESVYVHQRDGRVPEFGRIIFRSTHMAAWILGDQSMVEIIIRGRPIWLKRYIASYH